MLFRNLNLLWLFRFEERRELRNISLEHFSKGRGVGFGDFGMELKNLGSGAMTLTGQMGLSECNELPICPVVFSHLSDPLVFLTPWSGAKDNAPPPLNTALKTLFRISRTFYSIEESEKLRFTLLPSLSDRGTYPRCNYSKPGMRSLYSLHPLHMQRCR